MTDTVDASEAARLAAQEADEAEALVAELEGRLASGDESVTAEQLDEQHRLSRWARLRAEGASKKRAQADRAAALDSARAAVDQVAGIATHDEEMISAWSDVVASLRKLATISACRSQLINENQTLLEAHDAKLQRLGAGSIAELGVLPARYAGEKGYRIPDRGVEVAGVPASSIIATAIEIGAADIMRRGERIEVHSSRDLVDSTLTGRVVGWNDAAKAVLAEPSS